MMLRVVSAPEPSRKCICVRMNVLLSFSPSISAWRKRDSASSGHSDSGKATRSSIFSSM